MSEKLQNTQESKQSAAHESGGHESGYAGWGGLSATRPGDNTAQFQLAANNSPQVRQLMAFQAGADTSRQVRQLKAFQQSISQAAVTQRKENNTGLPDNLKSGVENLSGHSLDDVKVHYNSPKPAELQAHAYAQGSQIHLAPGQEQHLPHEAWHVVQQKQGRVQATKQLKGKAAINDDAGLEHEADVMGAKAVQMKGEEGQTGNLASGMTTNVIQGKLKNGGNELTEQAVIQWYATKSQVAIPADLMSPLRLLVKTTIESHDLDNMTGEQFIELLTQTNDNYRPRLKNTQRDVPIKGELSDDHPGSLKNWGIGQSSSHAVPSNLQGFTELAHVAYKATEYFDHKQVDPNHGANPGEFGSGFYLTSGHNKTAQEKISAEWGSQENGFPKEVLRFRIGNDTIAKLVDENVQHAALLVHMLQAVSGYPHGVNEDAAIAMMDVINLKGKVLLFPDDKEKKVKIRKKTGQETEDLKQTWSEYTQHNAGGSDHALVVGPQRPQSLNGIRQIAVRGALGGLFINLAERSWQTMQ